MKLSTKGRYGTRLMLDLAKHYGQECIPLKDIARRLELSEKYLWHLIPHLKKAGLIETTRGVHGGYRLAKPPAQITLKDIITVVEGDMCLVECVDNPSTCLRSSSCITRDIWCELTNGILKKLESYTLESVLEKEKNKSHIGTYSI